MLAGWWERRKWELLHWGKIFLMLFVFMTPRRSTRRFSGCIEVAVTFHLCWSLTWLLQSHWLWSSEAQQDIWGDSFSLQCGGRERSWEENLSSKTNSIRALVDQGLTGHQVQFPAQRFNCCRPRKHGGERAVTGHLIFQRPVRKQVHWMGLMQKPRSESVSQICMTGPLWACAQQEFSSCSLLRSFHLL